MAITNGRWVTKEEFDTISEIVTDYFSAIRPGRDSYNDWLTGLKTAFISGEREIFVSYGDNNHPVGVAIFNSKFDRLNTIYAKGNAQTERSFFDIVFNDLKLRKSRLTIPGVYLSETLRKHVEDSGFKRRDMHGMSINRTSIASWARSELPIGYCIEEYSPDVQDSAAEFLSESHKNTQTEESNPNWYETKEGWFKFLDIRKNEWIRVLRFEEMIVGMCSLIKSYFVDYEYIVNGYAIKPSFRRRGLGKTVLIHTIQDFVSSNENVECVTLKVRYDNPALRVYESLGFEVTSTSHMFAWSHENAD